MKYLPLLLLLSGCCANAPQLKPDAKVQYDGGVTIYALQEVYLKLSCDSNLGN